MSLLMDALRRAERDKQEQEARAAAARVAASAAANPAGTTATPSPQVGSEDITLQIAPQAVAAATARHEAREQAGSASAGPLELELEADFEAALPPSAPVAAGAHAAEGDHSSTFDLAAAQAAGSPAAGLALEPMENAPPRPTPTDPAADTLVGGGTTTHGVQGRREQTATLPSSRALENDMDAYFEHSRSMEAPRQRVLPEHTMEDVARHTVVTAETVFAATRKPRTNRLFLAVAVVAVLIVAGIGVVALLYAQKSPGPRLIPPPSVAAGVERAPASELPAVAATAPAVDSGLTGGDASFDSAQANGAGEAAAGAAQDSPFDSAQGRPFDPAQGRPFDPAQGRPFDAAQDSPFDSAQDRPFDPAQGRPFDAAQDSPFDAAQDSPFDSAQDRPFDSAQDRPLGSAQDRPLGSAQETPSDELRANAEGDVAVDTAGVAAAGAAQDAPVDARGVAGAASRTSSAAIPPPPVQPLRARPATDTEGVTVDVGAGEVRIARARTAAQVAPALAVAYDAYQRGDLAAAETAYRTALVDQPESRDALLGLGALAVARGDAAAAYTHYARVLARHPEDAVARAALFGLTGGEGEAGAARLRLLMEAHPEAAYLRFALGNWYARQARWADAQQAYFDAVRLDADNADYVFNLAVSLDRMGQEQAALGHYQRALTLADGGSANFNPSAVLERIGELGAGASAP